MSILIFGAAIGALIGGRMSDRFGRRHNILVLAIIFMIGTIGCVLSPPTWGGARTVPLHPRPRRRRRSATVPVYLSEVSPTERRGSVVSRNEVMIVVGQFAAFVINAVIFNIWGGEHENVWRFMLLVAVTPAIFLFAGMLRMPESPRWLMSQDRHDEALAVLLQVRSPPERARAELEEVRALAEEEKLSQTGGAADLSVKWIRRLIFIGVGLGVFQQATGINSVMYYGTQLLGDAGFSSNAAIVANTLNGLFSVIGVLTGVA